MSPDQGRVWEQLAQELRDKAFRIAYSVLEQYQDAEDALQMFDLVAWRISQGAVKVTAKVTTEDQRRRYLKRIIRNIANRMTRRRRGDVPLDLNDLLPDSNEASPDTPSLSQSVRQERLTEDVLRLLKTLTALEEADHEDSDALARWLDKMAEQHQGNESLSKALRREMNVCDKRTWRFRVVGSTYVEYRGLKDTAEQVGKATGREDISTSWVDHLKRGAVDLLRDVAFKMGLDLLA
jgi:DNA-directed RNA polymerase specialized sigma24 family protein